MAEISEVLAPLVGRWVTTISLLHPEEDRGTLYRAVDTYRWLDGRKVLIHEVEAFMGKPMVSFEVYTQASDGRIFSRNYAADGHVADYDAVMAQGQWRVTGEKERFKSTSFTQEQIEGLWEIKTDDGWKDWMTVKLERIL